MSALQELEHVLSQPPPPSTSSASPASPVPNNPIAIAHAALQHLRDSGDPNFLFLRSLVEITSDASMASHPSAIDPHKQELLFHCVTGFRHVLLHKWNSLSAGDIGKEFNGVCRDYLLELGMSQSIKVSKAVAMACLNASASFWKRSWNNTKNDAETAPDATLMGTLHTLITMMFTSSPSLLQHRVLDENMLLSHLQQVISYPIIQNHDINNTSIVSRSVMASSFLSTLIDEFAGTSRSTMSYYNLSLEYHRNLCQSFQEQFGLHQVMELGMQALGGAVQRLLHEWASHPTSGGHLLDLVAAIISLIGDTLSWDFNGGGWSDAQTTTTTVNTSATLLRPPAKWKDYIIHPDFLRALFSLYSSLQQSPNNSNNKFTSKHSIRQLILTLASLTGSIFTPETRKCYAELLVEGTLSILSSILSSIQSNSQDDGMEVVDMCCILSRIVSNFKLPMLSELSSFENLVLAMSSVGCEILKRQLSECQRVKGDIEEILDEGWEWREEAFNHILDASVMMAEGSNSLVLEGLDHEHKEKTLKAALATKLSAPLYTTFITTQIQISHLEERFLSTHADDVDEIREQISETNQGEQMEAAASLGRLNIPCAIQCLTSIWDQISPRLHSLFEAASTSTEVTPDAAALLEESCLLVSCMCYLLTDDNNGETPLIPLTVVEACMDMEATKMIVNMVRSLTSLAEYHASKIVLHPDNPNLSPFLGKTLLWFFERWVSSYALPPASEYSDYGQGKSAILTVWSSSGGVDAQSTLEAVTFCVTLCLHYYCYWPLETAVSRNATKLLLALAKRGVDCRRLVIATAPFQQLVALHAVTAGAWHGSSDAELDMGISKYGHICQNLSRDLVKGYQRISNDGRGDVLQGILSCCCDDDQQSIAHYECCLRSIQESFSNLIQALRDKKVHPQDVHAEDMASLCVFLHIGICQNYHPDHIPKYLTPILPHLSGLMNYYAEDLSICESLLRLFRDYSEQYISVLDPSSCLVLFQTSADLLKSYSTRHCASRVIHNNLSSTEAHAEEDQSYSDVLSAIQLLIHLGTKDFIDICSSENAGAESINTNQVTDIIFFGLQQILPLMTQGLLHYPTLCSHYFSLVGFMMDTYPEKACSLPYDLFFSLLESLLFGMSHTDPAISKSSLRGISEVAREHLKSGALQVHLSQHPDLLINCCRRLLQEVIFQPLIWDRLEASGTALLPLVAVNVQQFVGLINEISEKFGCNGKKERLQTAFERLLKPDVLAKVVSIGYEGRKNRLAFKKEFDFFVRDVHSFLIIH